MEITKVLEVGEIGEGEIKKTEINGQVVDVAMIGGEYYAFNDICSHEECSLSEGFLDGKEVVCPCHGSKFDVGSGAVKSLPAVTPIKTYSVKVENGAIMVCLM
ncbi:MAG: non-heme iron oxygenase ferredoxin subunit [Patescibacteria group bacterium]|nr:non-heme iron oxygenase ferredoxin subunit [Patescibacteria group bacterium]